MPLNLHTMNSKFTNNRSIRHACLNIPVFLAAIIWLVGCTSLLRPHPDPLAGWHFSSQDLDANKAIKADYVNYIQNLSTREQNATGPVMFFEDGTGQHAIRIELALNGTDWAYILFYNNENMRTKIVKYRVGHYAS